MLKEELRRQMRILKQQYSPQQLEELSLPVIARLKPSLAEAQVVLAYYSLPDEVNTHQLIDDLLTEGKTVLLPRVVDESTMELRCYTGLHDMAEGSFHIMEPIGEPFTDYSQIDIALIPGVAFDAQGHRLGRGKGYYDRFLRTIRSMGTVSSVRPRFFGLCFDFQKLPSVPVDANDIPVDTVV